MNKKKEITESDGALITKIERVLNRDSIAVIDYLTAENKVLKRVIEALSEKKKRRVVFTEIERRTLVTYALRLGDRMRDVVSIVKPETILAWHRRMKKKKWDYSHRAKKKGRPAIADDTRELIVRLARDNNWGYTRISGELLKIGHTVCPSTVKNVLKEEGIKPAPDRKGLSWKKFIESHMHNAWGNARHLIRKVTPLSKKYQHLFHRIKMSGFFHRRSLDGLWSGHLLCPLFHSFED